MHGVISPPDVDRVRLRHSRGERALAWVRRNRVFLAVVMLPTLLTALYYYGIAARQYESEAHFIVRSSDVPPAMGVGLGQLATWAGGLAPSQSESMSVADYLTSHDVVESLRGSIGLVDRFRRPEADPLSKLRAPNPSPEALLKFYRKHARVEYHSDTGITTVKVRAFRPEDSFLITNTLMQLGEQRVNSLNMRGYEDAVTTSRRQLREAEEALRTIQVRMDQFRKRSGDIDPAGSGQAQLGVVSQLTIGISQARAQLASMAGLVSPSSPQYVALASRVRALETQLSRQTGRLAGEGKTIASGISGYEDLKLRQEFAAKRYEAAAAGVERARDQALKKQLYLVRVVDPNLPVKALYPERGRIVLTVFFALLVAYGVGWMIAAGVREHAV